LKYFTKSIVSIIGAAMMLVAIVVGLFWSFQQITEAAAGRQQINLELDSANELLSSLKDAETGYRGFLLTGDEAFLKPYQVVSGNIVNQLRNLRQITLIPSAQQHLDAMMPLVEAELAETARVIELRRHQDATAISAVVNIGTAKRLMDSLRDETSEFLRIEKRALDEREKSFQLKIRTMFGIIIVAGLFAALLGIWFAYLKHQDAKHQSDNLIYVETQRFLVALQKKNDELESARLEAVTANNAKSDFLSSMSHELRTPLNAILGFAQLMQTEIPAPSGSQNQNINEILKAGWHLLELVNEILNLAQIESGKVILSSESVSLADVMKECQSMIEPQANQQNIRLTFSPFDTAGFVHVDRTRLKQCLINLLSNAIKYNRLGGNVSVDCTTARPDKIRINICDTGAGLSSGQLAQLFQVFNRLGQEGGAAEGSGIGLVVTKRLVELMGGKIGVESKVNVGSVFWLEFNRTCAPAISTEKPPRAVLPDAEIPGAMPVRTVLYVEDNPANQILVEQLITRRPDLRVICATTGNLGITFARANQPEVILMDINLPGISGIEAMKILRTDLSTKDIPVVAVSANAMPHDVEEAMQAGFFRYLTKPIQVDEFMQTLDAALKFKHANPIRQ
jgi:signal transduction histidine kinase/ActR/RegA family two-component response regulator